MCNKKVKFEGQPRQFFYCGRKYPPHKKKPSFTAPTLGLGVVYFNVGTAQEAVLFPEVNTKLVYHTGVNVKTRADFSAKAMEELKEPVHT